MISISFDDNDDADFVVVVIDIGRLRTMTRKRLSTGGVCFVLCVAQTATGS